MRSLPSAAVWSKKTWVCMSQRPGRRKRLWASMTWVLGGWRGAVGDGSDVVAGDENGSVGVELAGADVEESGVGDGEVLRPGLCGEGEGKGGEDQEGAHEVMLSRRCVLLGRQLGGWDPVAGAGVDGRGGLMRQGELQGVEAGLV